MSAPRSGPKVQTHQSFQRDGASLLSLTEATTAGPKDRGGLIEQPSMGMSTTWPR